jgi:UDP-3-O-[3-hydroxymyristoyl] glucosamine N-acyltransferase
VGPGRASTLQELAQRFSLSVRGSGAHTVQQVATLETALAQHVSFFANSKYRSVLKNTQAGAVILKASDAADFNGNCLISRNPYADFARVSAFFNPNVAAVGGIHPSALIESGARIDPSAEIGAGCFVCASATVGIGVKLHPHCIIGPDCIVGDYSELMPRSTLVKRVRLGNCVTIHSGAVIGADGFGFAPDQGGWLKVPQLGGVQIGDGCDIGANTTIDCGALSDTVLGIGVKLDNQIQIGHNVQIGDHTAIAGCTAIAGSTRIGANCMIAGAVGIAGHLEICDGVTIMAMSLVSGSITQKGVYAGAMPIMPLQDWRKNAVQLRRLDGTLRALNSSDKDASHDD